MYKQLLYTPSNVIQCLNTGCIAVVKHYSGEAPGNGDTIDVYDDDLMRIECFDVDNWNTDLSVISSVVVTFDPDDPSEMRLVTSHLRTEQKSADGLDEYDVAIWEFTEEFNEPVNYSPRPFRAFNIGDVI